MLDTNSYTGRYNEGCQVNLYRYRSRIVPGPVFISCCKNILGGRCEGDVSLVGLLLRLGGHRHVGRLSQVWRVIKILFL
jgi:hypothetical protein